MSSGRHGHSRKKIAEPSLQHHRVAAIGGFGHPTSFAWNGIDGRAKTVLSPLTPPPKGRNYMIIGRDEADRLIEKLHHLVWRPADLAAVLTLAGTGDQRLGFAYHVAHPPESRR